MVKTQMFTVPGVFPDGSVISTLAAMKRLAKQGAIDPRVRGTAVGIVAGTPASMHPLLVAQWIDQRTSFVRDPVGVEALHAAPLMLEMIERHGVAGVDCDDVAILAAALGLSVGIPAGFVVLAFGSSSHFQHVYTLLGTPRTGTVEVDPTRTAQGYNVTATRSGWYPI
jgi:hypothetical protein